VRGEDLTEGVRFLPDAVDQFGVAALVVLGGVELVTQRLHAFEAGAEVLGVGGGGHADSIHGDDDLKMSQREHGALARGLAGRRRPAWQRGDGQRIRVFIDDELEAADVATIDLLGERRLGLILDLGCAGGTLPRHIGARIMDRLE